jgi:hypothetical protein
MLVTSMPSYCLYVIFLDRKNPSRYTSNGERKRGEDRKRDEDGKRDEDKKGGEDREGSEERKGRRGQEGRRGQGEDEDRREDEDRKGDDTGGKTRTGREATQEGDTTEDREKQSLLTWSTAMRAFISRSAYFIAFFHRRSFSFVETPPGCRKILTAIILPVSTSTALCTTP